MGESQYYPQHTGIKFPRPTVSTRHGPRLVPPESDIKESDESMYEYQTIPVNKIEDFGVHCANRKWRGKEENDIMLIVNIIACASEVKDYNMDYSDQKKLSDEYYTKKFRKVNKEDRRDDDKLRRQVS
ncbi:hypothetical protein Tco_1466132 [Tanacetum coccineum]